MRPRDKHAIAPPFHVPVFDVPHLADIRGGFSRDTIVSVTEKIHGYQMRIVVDGGRVWIGSRTGWKHLAANTVFNRVLVADRALAKFIENIPRGYRRRMMIYGEVYGDGVQDMTYGLAGGEVRFAMFDMAAMETGGMEWASSQWLDAFRAVNAPSAVPEIYRGPLGDFDMASVETLQTRVPGAGGYAEGVVIRPVDGNTYCPFTNQRAIAKIVRMGFWTRERAGASA